MANILIAEDGRAVNDLTAANPRLAGHTCTHELVLGEVRIDLTGRTVTRGGRPVALTPQEFGLLEALVLNRDLALSREKLLEIAWGYAYEGESRTVDVHIQRLRRKLGLEKEIETVYKLGYRLNTK